VVLEAKEREALWELKASPAWKEEEDEQNELLELKTSPAFEEQEDDENIMFDPTEERRLSGTDPISLWGDVLISK